MTFLVEISPDDPATPSEQIRRSLAAGILAGHLPAGTRLAPVRQLAGDLDVAPGTVARAYSALEAAGLVSTHRGGGTRVRPQDPGVLQRTRTHRLTEHAAAFVEQCRALGADDDAIRGAVGRALGSP